MLLSDSLSAVDLRRRSLLAAGAALPAAAIARTAHRMPLLAAWAVRGDDGVLDYAAGAIDGPPVSLPARAHAVLPALQARSFYVVARRPGEYLMRADARSGRVLGQHDADDAFSFAGHAIVDRRRACVLATEIDALEGSGRIGVYDAATLRSIEQWPSHGIGSHELLQIDGDRIAVANGGIVSLPETGRVKRNVGAIESSLVMIDARDGKLLHSFSLPDSHASIRHLALARRGALGVALQIEGTYEQPLLAILRGQALTFAETAPLALKGYGGAIAGCADRFAVTCTRADGVAVWSDEGAWIGFVPMRKPSGIAVEADRACWVSNEFGEIARIDAVDLTMQVVVQSARQWDNHLAGIG